MGKITKVGIADQIIKKFDMKKEEFLHY